MKFPRSVRLRHSGDFQRLNRFGRRLGLRWLTLRYARCPVTSAGDGRFGLAVSRKVGNAVVRNRVKRWLREAIRAERSRLGDASGLTGVDVVFIARPSAAEAGFAGIRGEVVEAFGRIARDPSVSALLKESASS